MTIGAKHFIIDFWGCGARADDVDGLCAAIRGAVDAMGATLLELSSRAFSPCGFTAVAILAESHLAVHSWPETGYVAIDVFTCGTTVRPEVAIEVLQRFFDPEETTVQRIDRGVQNEKGFQRSPSQVFLDADSDSGS